MKAIDSNPQTLSEMVLVLLEDRFPWLGTDAPADGADTVEQLSELHQSLLRRRYVGANLGLSSTLETAKEQMAAAAKAAKEEAKAKAAKPASGKPEPAKTGAASTSAAKPQPAKDDGKKAPVAVAKPDVPKRPDPPQTASLFDFSTPAPAPSTPDASDDTSEDEEAIMAEIDAEAEGEEDDIAA